MWLDARRPKFTDLAGTTPAGYSAPVRRIDMRVPAGQYASAASDAERPLEENGVLNFHVTGKMTAPAASSVTLNNMTFALSYSMRDSWYGTIFKHASAALLGYYVSTGIVNARYVGIDTVWDGVSGSLLGSPPDYHQIPPCEPVAVVVRISPTALKISAVIRGVRTDFSFAHTNPASAVSGSWQVAGDTTPCVIKHEIVIARAISDAENDALLSWLAANPAPAYLPTNLDMALVHGDSIARSLNVTSRLDWWTSIAQESLCATRNINFFSVAQSGDSIGFQRTAYNAIAKPFYSASRAKNITVNPVGINNMRTLGQSAQVAAAEFFSFLDLQKADGFLPIACTVLPTTTVAAATTDAFNAQIRAEWASRGYADIADVAAVPGLADPNDTAIYPDGLHPSAAGNALMAPVYAAAVNRVRG
jgi:hypothetical protein